ncbi:hypothetical protein QWY20_08075 [Alkalimonas sp. MEB108]|uniref:Uncharacterized protein n=1 Tax=Alkalimonas cellulosilytica TaxID=3058395 RepID=A0ABU7J4H5_9GAMM|nr:hypothetical protein [Alkalimonas sp. MEB108]MEE2001408.1 hypothetical protein [Alkalimonas sp. MEB108]
MNKKIPSFLKYAAVFMLGFLTNFSGFLDNISSIPGSYKEFKKVYLYDGDLLAGNWSTNSEYLLGAGELGLGHSQPLLIVTLNVNEHDEVSGEILSKDICDALPLTWVIAIQSSEPTLFSIFSNRTFYVKKLKNNLMEPVAKLKLVAHDDRRDTLTFRRIDDKYGMLPEYIMLAKNLPAFEADSELLSGYCADSPKRFREEIRELKQG